VTDQLVDDQAAADRRDQAHRDQRVHLDHDGDDGEGAKGCDQPTVVEAADVPQPEDDMPRR